MYSDGWVGNAAVTFKDVSCIFLCLITHYNRRVYCLEFRAPVGFLSFERDEETLARWKS
uniref:Uncharacterized protein n=1 Tax=Anguilla anguilla TaxID=7936 RepID=A0A0E9TLG3_ANGAN